jgi:hypothetical protein
MKIVHDCYSRIELRTAANFRHTCSTAVLVARPHKLDVIHPG